LRRITYPLADAIVVQTDEIANWITHSLRLSAQVMPNPIDLKKFSPRPVSLGEPQSRCQLVAVGRLAPEKGDDLLIKAFAQAAKLNPAWDLVIYGDGPERAALACMIETLDLSERVVLAGNTRTVEQAYANADLFVHAARYDGYSNVIQEALAAGKPVIATDCPGAARQLLGSGRYGVLVPSEDVDALARALNSLMADDGRRASLARSARDAVLPFEVGRTAERWLELLRDAIDRKKRHRSIRSARPGGEPT
jgi:glycosyltransferase involved in cell wall biosynthesis